MRLQHEMDRPILQATAREVRSVTNRIGLAATAVALAATALIAFVAPV